MKEPTIKHRIYGRIPLSIWREAFKWWFSEGYKEVDLDER